MIFRIPNVFGFFFNIVIEINMFNNYLDFMYMRTNWFLFQGKGVLNNTELIELSCCIFSSLIFGDSRKFSFDTQDTR